MRSLRIYVAGASKEIEWIEEYVAALEKAGHVISHDWTKVVREVGEANPSDPKVRKASAERDLEGVVTCDVFWLVAPAAGSSSTGSWIELGYALRERRMRAAFGTIMPQLLIVASGEIERCIFADLADYRFRHHNDALDFIKRGLVEADEPCSICQLVQCECDR